MSDSCNVAIIVPVAPFEPLSVIRHSVGSIRSLDLEGVKVRVIYVLDLIDDERLQWLESKKIEVLKRDDNRGRRAGAINDALKIVGADVDYIAIFDVDSRPDPGFIVECLRVLQSNAEAAIASGARYITNENAGIIPRVISIEYTLIADLYRLFDWGGGIKQFNGLIGVLDARIFSDFGLDERVICEDFDFTQRVYLQGKTAAFTKNARVGEQAPTSLQDLFNQRLRWFTGGYQGLRRYFKDFLRADIPLSYRTSWLAAVTLPFICALFSPFIFFYVGRIWRNSFGLVDFMIRFVGTFFYAWFLEICGLMAIAQNILRREIEWTETIRTDT